VVLVDHELKGRLREGTVLWFQQICHKPNLRYTTDSTEKVRIQSKSLPASHGLYFIHKDFLFKILKNFSMPQKIINLIKMNITHIEVRVQIGQMIL